MRDPLRPGVHRPPDSAVPPGWQAVQLGDVSTNVSGGRMGFTKQSHYRSSGTPAFSAAGQDGYVERAEFRATDGVVLSAIGANCGRCFLAQGDWTTLANTQAILPSAHLDARYLFHRANREDYWPRSGSAQPFIKPSSIGKCWLLLPPFPEQGRIAEILDTLDEAIRMTDQVIAKLRLMKQGLLHDMLTRGLDENGELRDPKRHPEQFNDSPLGRIPRSWEVRPLVDIAEIRSGIAINANRIVARPEMVHYLRVANVQDGFLDLTEMSKIRVSRDDIGRYEVLPGDVLMNEGGDLDKLGRGSIWLGQFKPCVHQNHVFVVRSNPGLLPEFLSAWTGSSHARRYFMVAGKQTTNLASINKTALGQLPVSVPHITEQQAVVEVITRSSIRLESEQAESEKLRALKYGLMEDLLTGRVRIAVNEEIAS
jgi:type I restriction enzyme, S subunit